MEIQERKLSFLRSCAETILQDLPLHDTIIPIQPEPPGSSANFKERTENSEWPSLTQDVQEAPYRVPEQFDVEYLRSYLSARRGVAVDHIWTLREDPSYFKEVVLDWSEHRQEKILSVNGGTHPVLRRDLFWERVMGSIVIGAYSDFLIWDQLYRYTEELSALKAKHTANISLGTNLPEEYDEALCHFSHTVDQALKGPLHEFKTGLPSSPPLRNHYVREPQDPNTTIIHVKSKTSSYKKDHFPLALGTISHRRPSVSLRLREPDG